MLQARSNPWITLLVNKGSFWGLLGLSLLFLLIGIYAEQPIISMVIPSIVLGSYALVLHLKKIYVFLFFILPFSIELNIAGGIGIDFPGEILLLALSGIALLFLLSRKLPIGIITPIGAILIAQVAWSIVAMLLGNDILISAKWIAAKIWYILPFYVLPFYILTSKKDLHDLLDMYLIGLLCAGGYFFIDHGLTGFDFMQKTSVGKPFWRNHVNYACTLLLALPIIFYRYKTHRIGTGLRYIALGLIFLTFLYFSYARVAYVCIGAWIGYYFILRLRLTSVAIIISLLGVVIISYQTINNETFIKYAPEYTEAITQQSFENKINATLEGRDISTMERLHRWVAGYRIIEENPIVGIGPANFYNTYKPYTLYAFETYVSDNPEQSGIHNYYLMLMAEQGLVGFLLLLILLIAALVLVEQQFHRKHSNKDLLFMAGGILIMIITMNTINDMVEVIKIGSWFFFTCFLIQRGKSWSNTSQSILGGNSAGL